MQKVPLKHLVLSKVFYYELQLKFIAAGPLVSPWRTCIQGKPLVMYSLYSFCLNNVKSFTVNIYL